MIPQNLMVYRRFPHFFVARIGGVPNFQTGFMSRSPKLQVYTKLTPFSFVMGISRISQESWLVNNHGYPIWAYYPSKQLRSSGVLLYTKEGLHDQGWVVQPLHSRLSILTRWCPSSESLSWCVYKSNFTFGLMNGGYIYSTIVTGAYKPTNITMGASHCS